MPWLDRILKGLKPAIVSLVGLAALDMVTASLFTDGVWSLSSLSLAGVIGFAIGFVFYARKRLGVIGIVIVSAASGLALHLVGVI